MTARKFSANGPPIAVVMTEMGGDLVEIDPPQVDFLFRKVPASIIFLPMLYDSRTDSVSRLFDSSSAQSVLEAMVERVS